MAKMTMNAIRLGIDFGTTRTVVATPDNGNYPVCTFSWMGEFKTYIPSLIGVDEGRLRFGWDAEQLLSRRDASVLRSIKRLLGRLHPDEPVEVGPGVSLPLIELITGFLAYTRRMILRHSHLSLNPNTPLEAMVAVPANANSNQRYITLEAFRRAGFRVMGALNEPSAAAVEFLQRYLKYLSPKSPKKFAVVYDLGGGTFDTAVVGIADRGHAVLAHEGMAQLGGDDFDRVIFDMTLESCRISAEDLDPAAAVRLLEECRERKEGLNFNTRKMVVDPSTAIEGADPVMIETHQLYERCVPLIQASLETVGALMERLDASRLGPAKGPGLASVYLVGGSVAFPPVARKLREVYGIKVKTAPIPHASTAVGLAIAGDPGTGEHLDETVSRHFGIWRENGRDKVFDPIFHKEHSVDPRTGRLQMTRRYHPMHNVGLLRYLECSALGACGEPAGDITVWKDVYFPYDPALADRNNLAGTRIQSRPDLAHQEVLEIYSYDPQGIVQVEIENCSAGYRRRFRLEPGDRGRA
jgi:molecular chaperone DnaK (HSP70)